MLCPRLLVWLFAFTLSDAQADESGASGSLLQTPSSMRGLHSAFGNFSGNPKSIPSAAQQIRTRRHLFGEASVALVDEGPNAIALQTWTDGQHDSRLAALAQTEVSPHASNMGIGSGRIKSVSTRTVVPAWQQDFQEGTGLIWALLLAGLFLCACLIFRLLGRSAEKREEDEAIDVSLDADPDDPMTYLPAVLTISGMCSIVGFIVLLVAIALRWVNMGEIIHALLRFVVFAGVFSVATVVVVVADICIRTVYRNRHNNSPAYDVCLFRNDAAITNIHLQWRPALITLGKDLLLSTCVLYFSQHRLAWSAWLALVGLLVFLLQRCSWGGENKRRFVLLLGCPIFGFGMMCWSTVALPDTLQIGIAVLSGSLLETVSMIVILSKPNWCAHFALENATQTLEEQLKTIRTGDILLISGYERTSTNLRFFAGCDWSHVAMFLTNPPKDVKQKLAASWNQDSESRVWVLESDPEYADFVRGEKLGHSGGVQLVPAETYFEELAEYYDNKHICVVRHLILPEEDHRNQVEQSPKARDEYDATWNKNFPKLAHWLVKHGDAAYESHTWELIRSVIKWNVGSMKESTAELFCSELVARCYMKMELLSEKVLPDNYTPGDFSSLAPFNLNLHRRAGLTLEQRILAPS